MQKTTKEKILKIRNKYKYEYTVEETVSDTKVWTVKSNKKLSNTDLQEIACNTEEVIGKRYLEDDVESVFDDIRYGETIWDFTENYESSPNFKKNERSK